MIEAIISIILALISFFGSKKAGASDAQAAAVGVGAGLGSYYVATNTEWGKGVVSQIESWVGLTDNGQELKNDDGTVSKVPKGAVAVKNEAGNVMKDGAGNVLWKLVDSTGEVLTSWGAAGTAGVIATTAVATDSNYKKYLPWAIGGLGVFLLTRG